MPTFRTLKNEYPQEMPEELTFSVDELPEMENWNIGNTYTLTIKVDMTEKRIADVPEDPDRKRVKGRFVVSAVEANEDEQMRRAREAAVERNT